MATVLFVPFPEFGHINPTLNLAKSLKKAGHRVCYVTLADFEEYILHQGLEFIPILANRYPKGASGERSAQKKIGRVELIMGEELEIDPQTRSNIFKNISNEITAIVRAVSADLLIADYLIGGIAHLMVGECGIAAALLSVTLQEGWMMGEPSSQAGYSELPVLVLCPHEFDFPGARLKPNRYYVEPTVDLQRKEPRPFPWQQISNSKPLIYCSLGSESHLYARSSGLIRTIIQAMEAKPDWQLVLAIGPFLDTAEFQSMPSNVLIVNWAPQVQLLQRASIMITHGGMGTVKECILLEVPMIVFPFRWDQPHNAARVVAHGLGVRGNANHITRDEIVGMIDTVARNPSFKTQIAAMSKVFRASEESGKGRKIVEQIITDFQRRNALQPFQALPGFALNPASAGRVSR